MLVVEGLVWEGGFSFTSHTGLVRRGFTNAPEDKNYIVRIVSCLG